MRSSGFIEVYCLYSFLLSPLFFLHNTQSTSLETNRESDGEVLTIYVRLSGNERTHSDAVAFD